MTTYATASLAVSSGLDQVAAPDALEDYRQQPPSRESIAAAMDRLTSTQDWAALTWSELMEALMRIGRSDIPLARLAEGHVDALRICAQAGHRPQPGARYGVWASRSQATGVRAARVGRSVRLDGEIRFASGAGVIDRALVPVWLADGTHLLIDLDVTSLPIDRTVWQAAGMRESHSHTVTLSGVVVDAGAVVGPVDFYLTRPEFLAGGIGVAAVWAGCANRLSELTAGWLRRGRVDDAKTIRLGRLRTDLVVCACVVRQAGQHLDQLFAVTRGSTGPGAVDGEAVARASSQARSAVAAAVDRVVIGSRTLAGAAGIAFDPDLTRALDDLGLYVLQHHGDGDALALGSTMTSP